LLDRARAVGEAQVDLNRVRARRNALVAQLLADPQYQPLSAYKSQPRKMRRIDRVNRILGTSFDFDDIEPPIELKPLRTTRSLRPCWKTVFGNWRHSIAMNAEPCRSGNSRFARLILPGSRGAIQRTGCAVE
jgi:hypothetical protein